MPMSYMAAALFGWGGQQQQRQHQGIVGRNGADNAAVAAASAPLFVVDAPTSRGGAGRRVALMHYTLDTSKPWHW